MAIRVVLDTNCLVSALLFSKHSMVWLRHAWQTGHITPLASKDTVNELMRVLNYPKFKLSAVEQHCLLADYLPYIETVLVAHVPEHLPALRDSADQMFLSLAVVGQAEILISGDADILTIQDEYKDPPIMTLSQFKHWLENKSRETLAE